MPAAWIPLAHTHRHILSIIAHYLFLDNTQGSHKSDEYKFLAYQHWCVYMSVSVRESGLRICPYISSRSYLSFLDGLRNTAPLMVGWLFGFYGISTFVGYLTPNPFYEKCSISNNSIQRSLNASTV